MTKKIRVFQDWMDKNNIIYYSALLIESVDGEEKIIAKMTGLSYETPQEANKAAVKLWGNLPGSYLPFEEE